MEQPDYIKHWDDKFQTRAWGRYPPEDLVRFVGRSYRNVENSDIRVLEIGCGPGANLWFLHREGFSVAGIDGSPKAIENAQIRLAHENANLNPQKADLKSGNFSQLDWPNAQFDLVIDIFALYANPLAVIEKTLGEIHRVLKPGGLFYAKLWGKHSTGYGEGDVIEPDTFDNIPRGPCHDMGISHFFDETSIKAVFSKYFDIRCIDTLTRTDLARHSITQEFLCQFQKKAG
jgi:SAM-dependent methyltransferase